MSTYECWAVALGIVTVIVGAAGLYGLWINVRETKEIAKATKLQGDVLSRPAVSVKCANATSTNNTYREILVKIVNHSNVHAKIKIAIVVKVQSENGDSKETFKAKAPFDGTFWSFAAKDTYEQKISFKELEDRQLKPSEILTVHGTIETSAWNLDDFRSDPPFYYKWEYHRYSWVELPIEPL